MSHGGQCLAVFFVKMSGLFWPVLRITKRGDTLMRGILTECALIHIQHAPNSYVTKAYIRIGRKRGNGEAVAAARMLHVAYLILKERRKYHE